MYDIIGDIHGHADALEILLQKLKYTRKNGIYSHPEGRKAAFVGDFIDRGPKIRETLHLVKDMCDAGNAIAVMGNHEFNAICFHTPHTEKGGFFRDHSLKEIKQHIETLDQFKHFRDEWEYFLAWFKELPLYFENEDFRMVHACWDNAHINWIDNNYDRITADFLAKAVDKGTAEYIVIEETLKGKEQVIPNGHSFLDKDGTSRSDCRIRWWSDTNRRETLKDIMMECPEEVQDVKIEDHSQFYGYPDAKPVFFGHYWLKGAPLLENENAICLDYSVAKGGKLVACRLVKENGGLKTEFVY